MADGTDLAAEKQRLRAASLACRDALSPEERARAGAAIVAQLTALKELRRATTVMTFAGFRTEVDTLPILDWCRREGKRCALPKVTGRRTLACFAVADAGRDLAPGMWEIPEPVAGLPPVAPAEIDVVIVPGSAFDRRGGRIGYGGGFYDTYLRLLRPDVPRIAVGFACQLVAEVAMEDHDLRMDALVTEEGVLRFHREGD